jgi:hypothetical protein
MFDSPPSQLLEKQVNKVMEIDGFRAVKHSEPFSMFTTTPPQLLEKRVNTVSEIDGFRFAEHSDPFSKFDRLKNYIQTFTSIPIIWWPLSDPQRPLEQGKVRMNWRCVSDTTRKK